MLRRILFFAFLGPLFGTASFIAFVAVSVVLGPQGPESASSFINGLGFLIGIGVPAGYVLGIVPALASGVLFSLLRSAGTAGWRLNTVLALAGGVFSQAFFTVLFTPMDELLSPDGPSPFARDVWFSDAAFSLGATGAVSASVCSAVRQRRERKRQQAPRPPRVLPSRGPR